LAHVDLRLGISLSELRIEIEEIMNMALIVG